MWDVWSSLLKRGLTFKAPCSSATGLCYETACQETSDELSGPCPGHIPCDLLTHPFISPTAHRHRAE